MATELTADNVRMAYRLFLGREPESEAAVTEAMSYGSIAALRAAFLSSAEFRAGGLAPNPELVSVAAPPITVEWEAESDRLAALLAHVRATWTRLGHERPHWSVLSAESFTPERIGPNEAAFFASGATDCADLLAILHRHGASPATLPRLFEFGCGVGRVTAHFARAFPHVTACDISNSHMAMARDVVGGAENVTFRLAELDQFGMADPFDIWFSRIVLQHNPPPIMVMILRRALSLLAPGGFAVFQIPTYAKGYRFEVDSYLRGLDGAGSIEMHVLPQPVVFRLAEDCGCAALEVLEDMSAGPSSAWNSSVFVLRKRGEVNLL